MEINKPDIGVFKGIGQLQVNKHINKKYFPKIRNIHQFQYTHHHKNDYLSSFEKFFSHNKPQKTVVQERVKQHSNQSTLQFGQDKNNYFNALYRTDYKKFDKFVPPKPIIPCEQGVQLGNKNLQSDNQYMTTTMQKLGQKNTKQMAKVSYKDRSVQRFNPITGQNRTLSFGFEDFSMNRKNNYVANNFTFVPQKAQKFDIISGRKITAN